MVSMDSPPVLNRKKEKDVDKDDSLVAEKLDLEPYLEKVSIEKAIFDHS